MDLLKGYNPNNANLANPQTPGLIRNTSSGLTGRMAQSTSAPQQQTSGGLIGRMASTQTNQPTPAVTNETSPLSFVDRLRFSFGDREGKKKVLEAMGYKVYDTADGNFLLSKDGQTRPFDEKGWSLKDLADMAGSALSFAGFGVGEALGGPGGAGAGSAAGETVKQGIGKILGVRESFSPLEIGAQAAAGFTGSKLAGTAVPLLGKVVPEFAAKAGIGTAKETIPGLLAREVTTGGLFGGGSSFAGTLAQTGDIGQSIKSIPSGVVQGAVFQPAVGLGLRGLGIKPGTTKTTEVKIPEVNKGEILYNAIEKRNADINYKPTSEEVPLLKHYDTVQTSDTALRAAVAQEVGARGSGDTLQNVGRNIEEAFNNPTEANVALRKKIISRQKKIEVDIVKSGGVSNFIKNTKLGEELVYYENVIRPGKSPSELTPEDFKSIAEKHGLISPEKPVGTQPVSQILPQQTTIPEARLVSAPIKLPQENLGIPVVKGFRPTPEVGVLTKETPNGFNLTQVTEDKKLFTLLDKPNGEPKEFTTHQEAVNALDTAPGLEANKEYWKSTPASIEDINALLKTPPPERVLPQTNTLSPEEIKQIETQGNLPPEEQQGGVLGTLNINKGPSFAEALTKDLEKTAIKINNRELDQKSKNAAYLDYKRAQAVEDVFPNKTVDTTFGKLDKEFYDIANNDLSLVVPGKGRVSFADYIEAKLAEPTGKEGDVIYEVTRDIWKETRFNQLIKQHWKWKTQWDNATPKDIEPFIWATMEKRGIPNPDVSTSRKFYNDWQRITRPELQNKGLDSKNIIKDLLVVKPQKLTPKQWSELHKARAKFGDDILLGKYKKYEFSRFGIRDVVPPGKMSLEESLAVKEQKIQEKSLLKSQGKTTITKSRKAMDAYDIQREEFARAWAKITGRTEPISPVERVTTTTKEPTTNPEDFRTQIDPESRMSDIEVLTQYAQEPGFNGETHFFNKIKKWDENGDTFAADVRNTYSEEQIKQIYRDAQGGTQEANLMATGQEAPVATFAGGNEIKLTPEEQRLKGVDTAGGTTPTEEQMRIATAGFRGETPPVNTAREAKIKEYNDMLSRSTGENKLSSGGNKLENFKEKHPFMYQFANATGVPRAIMSSGDASAIFRQGLLMMFVKPGVWARGVPIYFKAMFKKGFAADLEKQMFSDPMFETLTKGEGKLSLSKLGGNVLAGEEKFQSNLISKLDNVPILKYISKFVEGSERGYRTFSNYIRLEAAKSLAEDIKRGNGGILTPENLRKVTILVNDLTGRGTFKEGGAAEASMALASDFFFAPRLFLSRLKILASPITYMKADPVLRGAALKAVFGLAGAATTAGMLASMAGANVEWDPRSTDWMKLKIGKTRVDTLGGFQQIIRTAAQIATGKVKSSKGTITKLNTGKYGGQTKLDVLTQFFINKESPIASLITDWLRGTDFAGQPISVQQETLNKLTPMVVQDLIDIANTDRSLLPVGLLGELGFGVQTY